MNGIAYFNYLFHTNGELMAVKGLAKHWWVCEVWKQWSNHKTGSGNSFYTFLESLTNGVSTFFGVRCLSY